MKNTNKKSNTTYILAMVVLTLVSFFVFLSFFTDLMPNAVSSTDDTVCRTYIAMKSFPGVKIGELFYNINQKCRVDEDIKIDLKNKNEAFEDVAIEMSRCWYRYGEGELDFLSNWDTSGNWCFLCGGVEMNKKTVNSFMFKDFISWSQENDFNESLTYYEYIGMMYSDIDDVKSKKLREDYEELMSDEELVGEYKDMVMLLGNQITKLEDLQGKSFDSSDDFFYVVYRYDRVDKKFEQQISETSSGITKGIVTSMLLSMAVEAVVENVLTGGLALPKTIIKIGTKIKGAADKIFKITELMQRVSKLTKKSGLSKITNSHLLDYGELGLEAEQITVNGIKTEMKLSKRIQEFEASPDDMEEFAEFIYKNGDTDLAKSFENIGSIMKELGVDNFKDIDKRIITLKSDKSGLLKKLEDSINSIDPKTLEDMAKKEGDIVKEIGDLEKLRSVALDEIQQIKGNGPISEVPGIKNYLRATSVIGGGVLGGYAGAKLNSNYNQYVDLLTREQYYRLCGTERGNFG